MNTSRLAATHFENNINTQPKSNEPASPAGPHSRYVDWSNAEKAIDKAVAAAHIAATASIPRKATKQAHILHNIAYKLFVDTAEVEFESSFDDPAVQKACRANHVIIEKLKATPL